MKRAPHSRLGVALVVAAVACTVALLLFRSAAPQERLHAGSQEVPDGPQEQYQSMEAAVPFVSGAAGSQREVDRAMESGLRGDEVEFLWFRIVDETDEVPLMGVRALGNLERDDFVLATSDESGMLAVGRSDMDAAFETIDPAGARMLHPDFMWVIASGFAPAALAVPAGGDSREQATVVRLSRSPSLEVELVGSSADLGRIEVVISTPARGLMRTSGVPYGSSKGTSRSGLRALRLRTDKISGQPEPRGIDGRLDWTEQVDAAGRCRFEDLPPGIRLRLDVLGSSSVICSLDEPLVLKPGEQATRRVDLPELGWIRGRLADQTGTGVPGQRIWVATLVAGRSGEDRPIFLDARSEVIASAITSGDGSFEIRELRRGRVLIGPAPPEGGRTCEEGAVSTRAVVVDVPSVTQTSEPLLLSCHRDLRLAGRTFGAGGEPLSGVVLTLVDGHGNRWLGASRAGGEYCVGALEPGTYRLVGWHQRGVLDQPVTLHETGDGALDLVLDPGGAIRACAEDSRPDASSVRLIRGFASSATRAVYGRTEDASACMLFEGLESGPHNVLVWTDGGRCGMECGIQVSSSQSVQASRIVLEPGVSTTFRSAGNAVVLLLFSEGIPLIQDALPAGGELTWTLPKGRFQLEVRVADEVVERREVDTISGGAGYQVVGSVGCETTDR